MRHHHLACQSPRKIGTLLMLGLVAGLLGGCETNGAPSDPLSELVAYSSGAQANARAGASSPAGQDTPQKPVTRAQAAMDCWAIVEKSRPGASLDARADFVTDCIDKKLGVAAKPDARPPAAAKPRQRAEAQPAI